MALDVTVPATLLPFGSVTVTNWGSALAILMLSLNASQTFDPTLSASSKAFSNSPKSPRAVSYTHLTLPTNREV